MDKKTISAFILIGLVIILMPTYYKLVSPQREAPEMSSGVVDTVRTVGIEPGAGLEPTSESGMVVEPYKIEEYKEEVIGVEAGEEDSVILKESFAEVETPLYIAKFSSKGAKLISFRLKEYDDRRGGNTEMIMKQGYDEYFPNAYLTFPGNNNFSTDELMFSINDSYESVIVGETYDLTFTKHFSNGGELRHIYTFHADNYRISLKLESRDLQLTEDYYFCWDGGVNVTELDTAQDLTYSKAYALMGGELEKFDTPGKGEKRMNPSGKVDWIAVRSKYFEIAIVPQGNTAGIDFAARKLGSGKIAWKVFNLALKMEKPGLDLNQEFILYVGPMDSKRLSSLGVGLEKTMNWGWAIIKPFSKFVLWSFKLLHTIIPNYGLVIVIFSVLIKIILWPLTQKSYKSMKKMQALQPLLRELKEKHKGEPQRMQKETARLYKEHKVNPMGGCLPMLLQMPLLYALFIVFRSTIELRGAPFMLWIKDLSMPDYVLDLGFSLPMYGNHLSVLPLLMGASTYFQSKSTMSDPNQKMMLYFMPIFLILIFNNFPSGLTLYYTLFNLLSMVQQKMVHSGPKADSNSAPKSKTKK